MSDEELTADSKLEDDDLRISEEMEQALEETGAELDALLNDIDDAEAELPQQADTETTEPEGAGDDDFDELIALPEVDDELDLSGGEVAELPAEEGPADEEPALPSVSEQPEAEPKEKSMDSDPLAEVAAIAAERNAEADKKQIVAGGKGMQIALAGISLLALIAAGFAAWQAYSNATRLDEMAMALQQRTVPAGDAKDGGAQRADLEKLMAQANEMAATLDGSLVEMRENNKAALDALGQRIDKLESAAARMETATAKAESTAPVAKPLVEKVPAATRTSSGGWSVNLISLSNENDADEELVRLRNLGIRAEKHRVEQDGRVWFRLRVPGFTSRDGAKAYIDTVEDKAGVSNAWVGRD